MINRKLILLEMISPLVFSFDLKMTNLETVNNEFGSKDVFDGLFTDNNVDSIFEADHNILTAKSTVATIEYYPKDNFECTHMHSNSAEYCIDSIEERNEHREELSKYELIP